MLLSCISQLAIIYGNDWYGYRVWRGLKCLWYRQPCSQEDKRAICQAGIGFGTIGGIAVSLAVGIPWWHKKARKEEYREIPFVELKKEKEEEEHATKALKDAIHKPDLPMVRDLLLRAPLEEDLLELAVMETNFAISLRDAKDAKVRMQIFECIFESISPRDKATFIQQARSHKGLLTRHVQTLQKEIAEAKKTKTSLEPSSLRKKEGIEFLSAEKALEMVITLQKRLGLVEQS